MNKTTFTLVLLVLIVLSSAALLKAGTFADGSGRPYAVQGVSVNKGDETISGPGQSLYCEPQDYFFTEQFLSDNGLTTLADANSDNKTSDWIAGGLVIVVLFFSLLASLG